MFSLYGPPQILGDCVCKGQWLLNQKAFRRLNLGDTVFEEFKDRVLTDALDQLQAVARQPEASKIRNPPWIIKIVEDNVFKKVTVRV
jgi:hypothetical protein